MNLTWRFLFNKLWQNLLFVFQIVFCECQVERFCVLKQSKVSLGRVRDLEWSYFRETDLISLGSSFFKNRKKYYQCQPSTEIGMTWRGSQNYASAQLCPKRKTLLGFLRLTENAWDSFSLCSLLWFFSRYTSAGGTEAVRVTSRSGGSDNNQERVRWTKRSRQEEGLMGVQAERTSPFREYHTLKPWLLNLESQKFVTQCQCWTIIMWNSLIMPNHAWTLCQKKLLYFTLRMLKGLNNKSNHFRLLEKKCCKQPILWEFVSWFLLTTGNVNSLACPYSAGHSTYLYMPD